MTNRAGAGLAVQNAHLLHVRVLHFYRGVQAGAALGQPETAAGDGVRLFEREGASAERHQGAGHGVTS